MKVNDIVFGLCVFDMGWHKELCVCISISISISISIYILIDYLHLFVFAYQIYSLNFDSYLFLFWNQNQKLSGRRRKVGLNQNTLAKSLVSHYIPFRQSNQNSELRRMNLYNFHCLESIDHMSGDKYYLNTATFKYV